MTPEEIQKQDKVYFAGLNNTNNAELPEWYRNGRNIDPDEVTTLTDIINGRLPNAQRADLYVDNPLNATGEDFDQINDWVAIVDPQRASLAAEGQDIKYIWHVPTDKYTIVPPIEAYSPLIQTLKQHNLDDEVFGEVLLRDYGGEVYIRMGFKSKQINGLPGDEEAPVTLGLESGYDFKGGRAVYSNMIGFDAFSAGIIRNITDTKSRRHVGNAIDQSHERSNNRVPIQEWWEDSLKRIEAMTDDLTDAIRDASQTSLAFTQNGDFAKVPTAYVGSFDHVKPYDTASFFQLHDMPDYLAEQAAANAATHGGGLSELTLWELFRGLTEALENQDRCDEGSTLNSYADVAMDLLWDPTTVVELADDQWNFEIEDEGLADDDVAQVVISRDSQTKQSSISQIDNTVEDGSLLSKREAVQQRQKNLRDFAQSL